MIIYSKYLFLYYKNKISNININKIMSQLNNMIYNLPFLDIVPKNTSINNKIQLGHPENPGASIILDGLNEGIQKYDSSYIISCQEYLNEGHSQNFASDFEVRYEIETIIFNIDDFTIENIIKKMENTNNNIFLKIDLCDERVYEILNLLNREKYIQIVCTELPIPKNQENIDIFTNYMGVDITQNIIKKHGKSCKRCKQYKKICPGSEKLYK